jgi:hypothetical protein
VINVKASTISFHHIFSARRRRLLHIYIFFFYIRKENNNNNNRRRTPRKTWWKFVVENMVENEWWNKSGYPHFVLLGALMETKIGGLLVSTPTILTPPLFPSY